MPQYPSNNPAPNGPGVPPNWARSTRMEWEPPVRGPARSGTPSRAASSPKSITPDVDTPQVKDFQLIITDGSTFFHDAQANFTSKCERISGTPAFRLTNTAIGQPYVVVQEVISEPDAPCLLVRTTLQGQQDFLDKLRVYVLLAPHVGGSGLNNNGNVVHTRQGTRLVASRGGLCFGSRNLLKKSPMV